MDCFLKVRDIEINEARATNGRRHDMNVVRSLWVLPSLTHPSLHAPRPNT